MKDQAQPDRGAPGRSCCRTSGAGTHLSTGTLHTYDAAGIRAGTAGDAATEREWQAWKPERKTSGTNADSGAAGRSGSSTAIVSTEVSGKRVMLEDLQEKPSVWVR